MKNRFGIIVLVLLITGCAENQQNTSAYDNLYLDYRITSEEGEDVACVFQYRKGGPEGEAVSIPLPGSIVLDGNTLEADSAGFSGIYYEQYFNADSSQGEHEILFTAPDKKKYTEKFRFEPFNVEDFPEQVPRLPFVIRLKNLPQGKSKVRLLLIDTAFSNNDVINLVEVNNGELHITDRMLRQLKSGPVSMEIYREQERPLKETPKAGGKIFISYGLQRDFELLE